MKPKRRRASSEYAEQLGWNRQTCPYTGLTSFRQAITKPTASHHSGFALIRRLFQH